MSENGNLRYKYLEDFLYIRGSTAFVDFIDPRSFSDDFEGESHVEVNEIFMDVSGTASAYCWTAWAEP